MPEIHYADVFGADGACLGREPYMVSDVQLRLEALEEELRARLEDGLKLLEAWGSLDKAQKDTILKNLLWRALMREGKL